MSTGLRRESLTLVMGLFFYQDVLNVDPAQEVARFSKLPTRFGFAIEYTDAGVFREEGAAIAY